MTCKTAGIQVPLVTKLSFFQQNAHNNPSDILHVMAGHVEHKLNHC